MTQSEQEQREKAEEVLMAAESQEEAQKAFQEAVRHVSALTPRDRARLRSKARRKQIRLNRAQKKAREAELLARQKARVEEYLRLWHEEQFNSGG